MSAADRREAPAVALPARGRARAAWSLRDIDPVSRIWRLFCSVRLALILILIIAAAVMAGTLLMQAPPSVVADSDSYSRWLEQARTKYGVWTDALSFFQLFNVFHSLWFRILVALLTANIIICTLNRWKGVWTTVFHTRVRMGDAFFQHARFNAVYAAAMPLDTAAERVQRAFAHARYRVRTDAADASSVALYAEKNRFSRFGTFASHLSIVMILAGAVIGSMWGFHDGEFIVPEGQTRDVGRGTGISVGLEHFADEYYLEGGPKDFRSDLIIYDHGVEVKRGTVHVNSPLSYKGVRFHQAFFGQTAVMEVKDETGNAIYNESVPLAWQTIDGARPIGEFFLPEKGLKVYVIGPASGVDDPMIRAGEMRVEVYKQGSSTLAASETVSQGTPKDMAGLTFTFVRESRFTGLKVVKDPGVNLIWIAGVLMLIGLVMLFYFPHRRVWAICKKNVDGTSDVRMATTAQRDLSQEKDFENLRERLRLALGISGDGDGLAEGGNNV